MNRWGLIGAISLALAGSVFFLGASRSYSPGPLSKGHAAFEAQCVTCHQPWHRVAETACEDCHRPERENCDHSVTSTRATMVVDEPVPPKSSILSRLPKRNQHACEEIGKENDKISPAQRIRAFNDVLGCLSCHHDHRGGMATVSEIAVDAGNNCTFCHVANPNRIAHASLEGVTGHHITGAILPLRRKFHPQFFTFRSPGKSASFKHAAHFEDFRNHMKGMEGIAALPCEFCHLRTTTSAQRPHEFALLWRSGAGANGQGCGMSGCHDQHSDTNLTSASLIESNVAGYSNSANVTVLRAEFRHSPRHLKYRCVECHLHMEGSSAVGSTKDPSMEVRNCFSCHAHQPAPALPTAAARSLFGGVASAALPGEQRIVQCASCHKFHSFYNHRTNVAESDFTANALHAPRNPLTHGSFATFSFDLRRHPSRITVIPLLGGLALALGGIAGIGFVRRLSRTEGEAEAPPPLVEITFHKDNFESNIPQLYVVGEVAGIASINIAARSGRQAVEAIASQLKLAKLAAEADVYDVAIVGCGPAGLGAATTAKAESLSYLALERMTTASSIRDYGRKKLVQAAPIEIREYGNLFVMEADNTTEVLISEWEKVISQVGIQIHERTEVIDIRRTGGLFEVKTQSAGPMVGAEAVPQTQSFKSRYVVVAIGVRGAPNHLGGDGKSLSGETPERVLYKCVEPTEFQDKRILVVGGGNAGAEVAQSLADPALRNTVSYSFREPVLSRPSRENVEKVAKLQTQKFLKVYPGTQVREITPGRVVLEPAGSSPVSVPGGATSVTTLQLENDFVFAMLGAKPPPFIKQVGIRMIRRGRPS